MTPSTSPRSLGEIFQPSRQRAPDPSIPATSDNAAAPAGPLWPYLVGAIAGGMFGFGALLLLSMVLSTSPAPALGRSAVVVLAVGSSTLAIAWLGMIKQGHDGVGALFGCLAMPAAILFMYATRHDVALLRVNALLLQLAIASFALGHLFVRGIGVTRLAAAIVVITMTVTIYAMTQGITLGSRLDATLSSTSLVGLCLVGCSLAFMLPGLRRRPAATSSASQESLHVDAG
ncbi:MAG: hypothetical protein M3680_21435 [Myxococcota bacterium]|nr:hypothetical protein [Myxococcota bacterium]